MHCSRLVSHAIAGESLFMLGCKETDFEEVKPYLMQWVLV